VSRPQEQQEHKNTEIGNPETGRAEFMSEFRIHLQQLHHDFGFNVSAHFPDRGETAREAENREKIIPLSLYKRLQELTVADNLLFHVEILHKFDAAADPDLDQIILAIIVEGKLHCWIGDQLPIQLAHLSGVENKAVFVGAVQEHAPDPRLVAIECGEMENGVGG